MFYNNQLEVVKLLQHWMPQIKIIDNTTEAKEILETIQKNFDTFK